ncbi:MAG: glutathione S-transferase family protein [Paracoccaceae bacterium]
MLRLHCAPQTISVATAITLTEAGLPFQPVAVDFATAQQTTPGYHAINPKGRVPALETPQGILTETGALLEYAAALAPEAGLVPQDPFQAALMREMMFYLASTMHVNHAHKMRGHRWAEREDSHLDMRAKVPQTMAASCAWVESRLQGPYLLGDALCLADPYLFTICTWLPGDGVDISAYPRLAAHHAAMNARASVAHVRALGLL